MDTNILIIKAHLMKNGQYVIPLTGRCMEPLLKAGDKAEIIRYDDLKVGKLYLFKMAGGALAVHRLIIKDGEQLTLKGDRTKKYEIIKKSDIIGEVRRIKFEGNEAWHEMDRCFLLEYIAAMLSRQSMFDKIDTPARKFISEICIRMNIYYGTLRRKK